MCSFSRSKLIIANSLANSLANSFANSLALRSVAGRSAGVLPTGFVPAGTVRHTLGFALLPSAPGRVRGQKLSPGTSSAVGSVHVLRLAHLRGVDRPGFLSPDGDRRADKQPGGRTSSAEFSGAAACFAWFSRRGFFFLFSSALWGPPGPGGCLGEQLPNPVLFCFPQTKP